MGKIQKLAPVKLFIGVIGNSKEKISETEILLSREFGAIDCESETIPFNFTDYYSKEMGSALLRKWLGFEQLISPDKLPAAKIITNKIEKGSAVKTLRQINLDPGYVNLSKIVLASTKDFSHRIYLSKGIFGEITLIYKQKEFTFLPWTYPDYKSEPALHFFKEARALFYKKLGDQ